MIFYYGPVICSKNTGDDEEARYLEWMMRRGRCDDIIDRLIPCKPRGDYMGEPENNAEVKAEIAMDKDLDENDPSRDDVIEDRPNFSNHNGNKIEINNAGVSADIGEDINVNDVDSSRDDVNEDGPYFSEHDKNEKIEEDTKIKRHDWSNLKKYMSLIGYGRK